VAGIVWGGIAMAVVIATAPAWLTGGALMLAAALIGGLVASLAEQLMDNGLRLGCIDWGKVANSMMWSAVLSGPLSELGSLVGRLMQPAGAWIGEVVSSIVARFSGAAETGVWHIGGLEDCVPRTAQRLANALGAKLDVGPIFRAAGSRNIIGASKALSIIQENSNMVLTTQMRLGAAAPGQYAVLVGNHMMHAEVAAEGILVFDSSVGAFLTEQEVAALKSFGAYKFELGGE